MAYDGILYNSKWYDRSVIKSVSTIRAKSMISEEFSTNTLTAEIYSDDIGDDLLLTVYGEIYAPYGYDGYVIAGGSDIRNYTPFAPVELWNHSTLLGKYYLTSVERTARNWFKLEAVSPVGILEQKAHKGGLYNQQTFSAICADIIGSSVTYTVDSAIASLSITGWLPYATARENLQQLLFAVGAAATYDSSGNMVFKYNEPDVSVEIPDGRLYQGGSVAYPTKASKVTLIEHAWYQDTTVEEDVLFDNTGGTTVTNSLVVFDNPYHSLTGSGLTVTTVNCNCCYVTGTGTLTGQKYAHTQRELVQQDASLVADEMRVENATLVSSLNSLNCLRRIYNYYRNANEISYGIVNDGSFKCGDLISFTDPFGDDVTGYVKEMTETVSGIIKSDTKIATNWVPKYLGNTYENSMIITASDLSSGTWNVPSAMQGNPALIVLFAGFGGGQGGYNGADGESKSYDYPFRGFQTYLPYAGTGGNGGAAGDYPKYKIIEYESLASSYAVSFGTGGAGGASNGGAGSAGTHSTFGSYDTDTGETLTGEYVNLLTGAVVASKGSSGYKGGDGGATLIYNNRGSVTATTSRGDWRWERYSNKGANGGAVGAYSGGAGCYGAMVEETVDDDDDVNFYDTAGCGGGGAAYGANGGAALDRYGNRGMAPQAGGDGANATAPANASLGKTGTGGNGGGGGGAGGITIGYLVSHPPYNQVFNMEGDGGTGSVGGKGSDGFALIYY